MNLRVHTPPLARTHTHSIDTKRQGKTHPTHSHRLAGSPRPTRARVPASIAPRAVDSVPREDRVARRAVARSIVARAASARANVARERFERVLVVRFLERGVRVVARACHSRARSLTTRVARHGHGVDGRARGTRARAGSENHPDASRRRRRRARARMRGARCVAPRLNANGTRAREIGD